MAHGKPALPSRPRTQCRRVHRIPFPTSVTIAKRPSVGQDGGDVELIWVSHERKYFCEQDWTASIRLIGLNKSAGTRRARRDAWLGKGLRIPPGRLGSRLVCPRCGGRDNHRVLWLQKAHTRLPIREATPFGSPLSLGVRRDDVMNGVSRPSVVPANAGTYNPRR